MFLGKVERHRQHGDCGRSVMQETFLKMISFSALNVGNTVNIYNIIIQKVPSFWETLKYHTLPGSYSSD